MKHIDESGFKELEYFPKVFGALAVLGLLAAAIGKRWGAWLWTALLLGFSCWALVDFYRWESSFGHDLNPDAAIKMEEMVYQPPLIGTKTLLNIDASSYPDLAGYGMVLSLTLGVAVSFLEYKRWKKP
jgi:copper chaperone NosL